MTTTKTKTLTADQAFDLAKAQLVLTFKTWAAHKDNIHRWSPKAQKQWLKDLANELDDAWLATYIRSVVGS